MMILQRDCKDILIPQSYAYGLIEPLIKGDIERYILVSELLGRDLSKSLKQTSVDNIKKNINIPKNLFFAAPYVLGQEIELKYH